MDMQKYFEQRQVDILKEIERLEAASDPDYRRIDALIAEAKEVKRTLEEPVNSPGLIMAGDNRSKLEAFSVGQGAELRAAIAGNSRNTYNSNESLSFGRAIKSILNGDTNVPERRAMATTGSGAWVIKEDVTSLLIPEIMAAAKVTNAGAMIVPLSEHTTIVPKVSENPSVEWKTENESYAGSETFSMTGVTFEPKTLMGLITVSQELLQDSAISLEAAIEQMFREVFANEIDKVCLIGNTGSGEPKGLASTEGILTEVGSVDSYTAFSNAYYKLAAENIEPTGLIIPSSMMKTLDNLREDGETGAYLAPPQSWSLYNKYVSNNAGDIAFMGRFRDMMIGIRTELTIDISNTGGDMWKKLQTGIRAYLRMDMQVKYAESFCAIYETIS